MGTLSVIATPIGNLEDVTLRAIRIMQEADVILCEDTRVTTKLCTHYGIRAPLRRYDAHASEARHQEILDRLARDERVVLVTDAGTPGISDPGFSIINRVRDELPDARIEAIPGPSALTAALSIAGISAASFLFLGFLPHKKGRQTLFRQIADSEYTVVFFESPHRLLKALGGLSEHIEEGRRVAVVRELTKIHESVVRGSAGEVLTHFDSHPDEARGECVIIVEPRQS